MKDVDDQLILNTASAEAMIINLVADKGDRLIATPYPPLYLLEDPAKLVL